MLDHGIRTGNALLSCSRRTNYVHLYVCNPEQTLFISIIVAIMTTNHVTIPDGPWIYRVMLWKLCAGLMIIFVIEPPFILVMP